MELLDPVRDEPVTAAEFAAVRGLRVRASFALAHRDPVVTEIDVLDA